MNWSSHWVAGRLDKTVAEKMPRLNVTVEMWQEDIQVVEQNVTDITNNVEYIITKTKKDYFSNTYFITNSFFANLTNLVSPSISID